MCKIMEEIAEKRFQKGIQEGIQKGIKISIRLCRQFGLSDEQIIEQIATEYHLSKKEAAEYVYTE